MVKATITKIHSISPTVRLLELATACPVSFEPGQWIDLAVMGIEAAGGFSIVSSATTMRAHQTLAIAVRRSRHPVAAWVHAQAGPGAVCQIQVGGSFVFATPPGLPSLFVAGGIGITPLIGMIRDRVGSEKNPGRLIYMARSQAELLFHDDLTAWSLSRPQFDYRPRVTGPEPDWPGARGRLQAEDLAAVLTPATHLYVCGPPAMTDAMLAAAAANGLPNDQSHAEKWW